MKKKKTTNSLTSYKRQSLNISQKETAASSYVICRAQSFPYRESHFIKPNICIYRKKSTHPAAICSRPLVFLVNKLTALAHHQNRDCRTCVSLSDAPSGILGICEGALCGAKCSLRCNCVSRCCGCREDRGGSTSVFWDGIMQMGECFVYATIT